MAPVGALEGYLQILEFSFVTSCRNLYKCWCIEHLLDYVVGEIFKQCKIWVCGAQVSTINEHHLFTVF